MVNYIPLYWTQRNLLFVPKLLLCKFIPLWTYTCQGWRKCFKNCRRSCVHKIMSADWLTADTSWFQYSTTLTICSGGIKKLNLENIFCDDNSGNKTLTNCYSNCPGWQYFFYILLIKWVNSLCSYREENLMMTENFKEYTKDVPDFLHERPKNFIRHCQKEMSLTNTSR